MEQSSIAADIAQALFYTVGTVAVIVGAVLGWRRFIREEPDAPRWEVTVGDPRVRYNDGEYRFVSELLVSNRSRSPYDLGSVWLHCVHPDKRFEDAPTTSAEADSFFGEAWQRGRRMPSGAELRFTALDDVSSEPAIVRIEYAIDVGEATLIFGRAFKPVHLDDMALYRNR